MESTLKNADMTLGAAIFTLCLCALFGGNGVAIKLGLTGLSPFTSAGIRFSMAVCFLLLWVWYQKIPLIPGPGQWQPVLIQSLFFTVQVSLFHLGLFRTTASHGALISNALPFMVLILAHLFIPGDRITVKKSAGIVLGFMGVLVLFFDAPDLKTDLRSGDLFMLAAVLCWAMSAVYLKRIISGFHPVQITLLPMIFSIPFIFAGAFFWDHPMVTQVTPTVVGALLFQAVVTTSFGFVAWNSLLKRFGATVLHSFIFVMPISGVFFGVMILDEPLTGHLLISIGFIVAGILVVNVRKRKKLPPFPIQ